MDFEHWSQRGGNGARHPQVTARGGCGWRRLMAMPQQSFKSQSRFRPDRPPPCCCRPDRSRTLRSTSGCESPESRCPTLTQRGRPGGTRRLRRSPSRQRPCVASRSADGSNRSRRSDIRSRRRPVGAQPWRHLGDPSHSQRAKQGVMELCAGAHVCHAYSSVVDQDGIPSVEQPRFGRVPKRLRLPIWLSLRRSGTRRIDIRYRTFRGRGTFFSQNAAQLVADT